MYVQCLRPLLHLLHHVFLHRPAPFSFAPETGRAPQEGSRLGDWGGMGDHTCDQSRDTGKVPMEDAGDKANVVGGR